MIRLVVPSPDLLLFSKSDTQTDRKKRRRRSVSSIRRSLLLFAQITREKIKIHSSEKLSVRDQTSDFFPLLPLRLSDRERVVCVVFFLRNPLTPSLPLSSPFPPPPSPHHPWGVFFSHMCSNNLLLCQPPPPSKSALPSPPLPHSRLCYTSKRAWHLRGKRREEEERPLKSHGAKRP